MDRSSLGALDCALLLLVQDRAGGPTALRAARGLSLAGEHAGIWVLASLGGATFDAERRPTWLAAGASALAAHAAAVVLKRAVRRSRPSLPGLTVHGRTVSALSFPSAHASSTTGFAVALMPVIGSEVLALPTAMGLARMLLGVHYPSDVAVGTVLGAVVGSRMRRPR